MAVTNSINANTSGFQSMDTSGNFNGRTFQQGSGITITNPDGISGNPVFSSSSATPNSNILLSDDFFGAVASNASPGILASSYSWRIGQTGFYPKDALDNGHPGILGNGATGNSYFLSLSETNVSGTNTFVKSMMLSGGALTLNWVAKIATLSTASPRYSLTIGLADAVVTGVNNGVYFTYSDNVNSGKWVINTINGGVSTSTNTTTTADTNWHNFQISINAAGTSAQFFIDGVSQGTIGTNIPTANAITPLIDMEFSVGTPAANMVLIDLFYLNQTLTSAR